MSFISCLRSCSDDYEENQVVVTNSIIYTDKMPKNFVEPIDCKKYNYVLCTTVDGKSNSSRNRRRRVINNANVTNSIILAKLRLVK
ncbi:hypothetical protein [Pteropox virus]|uniref:Uncharacterized protein n=1 Tax=Pteropox virus TaxID=1873698 RepID=A0A1B1MRK4_9POXV|nr:hypothetical protein [Pteropox virus]ANS71217.1 hypothetical protein [Pteropox virus]